MITITKEKNIMKIVVEGTNGFYALDINSGDFYGKKGGLLKAIPCPYEIRRAFHDMGTLLGRMVSEVLNYDGTTPATLHNATNLEIFSAADKIDALKLGSKIHYSRHDLKTINSNFPMFVKYLKTIEGEFDRDQQRKFFAWLNWEKAKKALGQYAETITPEMYDRMTCEGRYSFTESEWGTIAYYLVKGKFWEYSNHNCERMRNYITICRAMEKTPNRQSNFMREYVETLQEYEQRKTEYDNARLVQNYQQKAKAFTFTFGEYSVVVPTCTTDIINEGANMHHCVGGYVNDVVQNKTYIVFVRKTNTPKECYITAQARTDGTLGQYYLAYDRYIHTQEDRDFYEAFAKHLRENW